MTNKNNLQINFKSFHLLLSIFISIGSMHCQKHYRSQELLGFVESACICFITINPRSSAFGSNMQLVQHPREGSTIGWFLNVVDLFPKEQHLYTYIPCFRITCSNIFDFNLLNIIYQPPNHWNEHHVERIPNTEPPCVVVTTFVFVFVIPF